MIMMGMSELCTCMHLLSVSCFYILPSIIGYRICALHSVQSAYPREVEPHPRPAQCDITAHAATRPRGHVAVLHADISLNSARTGETTY